MSQQKRADWVRLAQSPAHIERIEAFSAATVMSLTGMILTPLARRSPACSAFTIAAASSTASPVGRWFCTPMRSMTARQGPRRGFATGWCTLSPR